MHDGIYLAIIAALAPCLLLIVKRLTRIEHLVNSEAEKSRREIRLLRRVIQSAGGTPPEREEEPSE